MGDRLRCRFIAAAVDIHACKLDRQPKNSKRRPYLKLKTLRAGLHAMPAIAQHNETNRGGVCSVLLQHLVIQLRNRFVTC